MNWKKILLVAGVMLLVVSFIVSHQRHIAVASIQQPVWKPLRIAAEQIPAPRAKAPVPVKSAPKKLPTPKPQPKPAVSKSAANVSAKGSLNLDILAKSVSVAETGGCKKGSAISRNNCFGIMQWDKYGRRSLKWFQSHQHSFDEFKRIWAAYYKKFPNQALANRWVNGDYRMTTEGSRQWLATVIQVYRAHWKN